MVIRIKISNNKDNFLIILATEVNNIEFSGKTSEKIPEISGPITRRKEYQIMQNTLLKSQEGNSNENSLLKRFDEFYKDNKNVENEMYFYRKPRVDKKFYQVEIKNIKLKEKPRDYSNAENDEFENLKCRNIFSEAKINIRESLKSKDYNESAPSYFENNSDDSSNLKVLRAFFSFFDFLNSIN